MQSQDACTDDSCCYGDQRGGRPWEESFDSHQYCDHREPHGQGRQRRFGDTAGDGHYAVEERTSWKMNAKNLWHLIQHVAVEKLGFSEKSQKSGGRKCLGDWENRL